MAAKHSPRPHSAAASSELEQEATAITALLSQEEDEHWQIGVHFNRIVDGHLAQKGGFKTAQEFLSQRLGGVSHSTLSLYGQIAKTFSEEVAKKYGSSKLAILLTYEKLTDTEIPKGDPANVEIKIPGAGGAPTKKPFADCSREQLQAAIHALKTPPKPLPPADRAMIKAIDAALEQALGPQTLVVVRARPSSLGTQVTINLPIGYMERLRDVLDDVLRLPKSSATRSALRGAAKSASRKDKPIHPIVTGKQSQTPARRNGNVRRS